MKSINESNFKESIKDKKVLIDFWATWCGPCRALAPKLEEISKEQSEVEILKIDVDQNPNLASQFGVRGIPTLIFLDKEVVKGELVGNVPKEDILKLISKK